MAVDRYGASCNSSAFRAMDIRCSKVQEMILDDQELRVKWLESCKMVADLNSKQLPRRQFEFLRDIMNGYALVYERHRDYLKDRPNVSSWRNQSVQAKEKHQVPATAQKNRSETKASLKRNGKGISAKKVSSSTTTKSGKRKSGKDSLIELVRKLKK